MESREKPLKLKIRHGSFKTVSPCENHPPSKTKLPNQMAQILFFVTSRLMANPAKRVESRPLRCAQNSREILAKSSFLFLGKFCKHFHRFVHFLPLYPCLVWVWRVFFLCLHPRIVCTLCVSFAIFGSSTILTSVWKTSPVSLHLVVCPLRPRLFVGIVKEPYTPFAMFFLEVCQRYCKGCWVYLSQGNVATPSHNMPKVQISPWGRVHRHSKDARKLK